MVCQRTGKRSVLLDRDAYRLRRWHHNLCFSIDIAGPKSPTYIGDEKEIPPDVEDLKKQSFGEGQEQGQVDNYS
jgi:hypothetical protein